MSQIMTIRKRNGEQVPFDSRKITRAIYKAAVAVGGDDWEMAEKLTEQVVALMAQQEETTAFEVEEIQNLVEKVLIEDGHAKTARAFILYREKRRCARESNALIGATIDMFSSYMADMDWRVKENANAQKSINGLNNYIRETFTRQYWLHEVYPDEVRNAHISGDLHLHDLGFFGAYCAGWDLRQLLTLGFGGVPGKVESRPAKHLRSFLGQIVNSTFTTQGETAGAQAWSSFDTYCAPFIRYDKLDYKTVKQALQEFIFNLNVPTRVGFQCPFSNLTFDLKAPSTLRDQAVIIGGEPQKDTYGDFQAEMDMFNKAFCDVMMEGDKKGRVFTFPIPTINVTKDFPWDSEVVNSFMEITCKYGIPYFSNYINSDLSPEDALSMCCRLRLDTKELRNTAKTSLEIKRKAIEEQTQRGMYPYCARYLEDVKARSGEYWSNHFNTIGLVGMNEACENFMGKNLTTEEGQRFACEILDEMRDIISSIQEETGHFYNLEATPAEGTSYRLASMDKERYPEIIAAGENVPYYTNSTQLPVGFTDDIFETLDLQDELQCKYTGGTVLHLYLGEEIKDIEIAKSLIKKAFTNYKLPYISLTPTFS
ncbi:MAG: ribonucleoside triphosphate reductase, partial [Angelakisella sp.]